MKKLLLLVAVFALFACDKDDSVENYISWQQAEIVFRVDHIEHDHFVLKDSENEYTVLLYPSFCECINNITERSVLKFRLNVYNRDLVPGQIFIFDEQTNRGHIKSSILYIR